MNIYFIRHGETDYNRGNIHQSPDIPLSDIGREQMRKTAERLKELSITKLITSDFVRAHQSAEIIGEALHLMPEFHTLFREMKRPSELYGHKYVSLDTVRVGLPILLNLYNSKWHYSDEENIYDLKKRVSRAEQYLTGLVESHSNIAVISHAFIINIFITYMCGRKTVRMRDYLRALIGAKNLANGSISTVTFSDDHNPHTCDWVCISHNDKAHLKA